MAVDVFLIRENYLTVIALSWPGIAIDEEKAKIPMGQPLRRQTERRRPGTGQNPVPLSHKLKPENMTNLLFFLWMLLFPLVIAIVDFIQSFQRKLTDPLNTKFYKDTWGDLFTAIIYLWVGFLLFKFQ